MLVSVSTGCSSTGIGSCPGSGTRQFHTRNTCMHVWPPCKHDGHSHTGVTRRVCFQGVMTLKHGRGRIVCTSAQCSTVGHEARARGLNDCCKCERHPPGAGPRQWLARAQRSSSGATGAQDPGPCPGDGSQHTGACFTISSTLKNHLRMTDGTAVGYIWQTLATRMAQLTPPRKPATFSASNKGFWKLSRASKDTKQRILRSKSLQRFPRLLSRVV